MIFSVSSPRAGASIQAKVGSHTYAWTWSFGAKKGQTHSFFPSKLMRLIDVMNRRFFFFFCCNFVDEVICEYFWSAKSRQAQDTRERFGVKKFIMTQKRLSGERRRQVRKMKGFLFSSCCTFAMLHATTKKNSILTALLWEIPFVQFFTDNKEFLRLSSSSHANTTHTQHHVDVKEIIKIKHSSSQWLHMYLRKWIQNDGECVALWKTKKKSISLLGMIIWRRRGEMSEESEAALY